MPNYIIHVRCLHVLQQLLKIVHIASQKKIFIVPKFNGSIQGYLCTTYCQFYCNAHFSSYLLNGSTAISLG